MEEIMSMAVFSGILTSFNSNSSLMSNVYWYGVGQMGSAISEPEPICLEQVLWIHFFNKPTPTKKQLLSIGQKNSDAWLQHTAF